VREVPFRVNFTSEGDPFIVIPSTEHSEEKTYTPEQIVSLILKEAIDIVKNKTGRVPDECVLTVPADFNVCQRNAMLKAAKIAGLPNVRLFEEQTAAVYAYRRECSDFKNGNVLVVDYSRRSLKLSIVRTDGDCFETKSVLRDSTIGLDFVTKIVMDEMISRFKKQNRNLDVRISERSMERLKVECEEAIVQLSIAKEATTIVVSYFFDGKDLYEKLTRTGLEFMCDTVTEKIYDLVDTVLERAGFSEKDISEIIMFGHHNGLLRLADESISERFDEKPRGYSPEAVAIGAAGLCEKYHREEEKNRREEEKTQMVSIFL
jgi:L1 cell adhesion molecule like protein